MNASAESWRSLITTFSHSSLFTPGFSHGIRLRFPRPSLSLERIRMMSHGGSGSASTPKHNDTMDVGKLPYSGCVTRIISLKGIPDLPTRRDVTDETYRRIYHEYTTQPAQHDKGGQTVLRSPSTSTEAWTNAHLLSCAITSLTTGIAPPVAFPTETVYGLGADATNVGSIAGIFAAKGRPSDNPLIVHVSSMDHLERCLGGSHDQSAVPAVYQDLVKEFWPGPLTILLSVPDAGKGVTFAPNVHPGQLTIGFRVPESPYARFVIAAADRPIAAPSANSSGKPSPTAASHVRDDLNGKINFILDGGDCGVGVESTVVDGLGDIPLILRPGGLSKVKLRAWGKKMNNVWQYVENGWESKHPQTPKGDHLNDHATGRPTKRQKLDVAADMFESPAVQSPSSNHEDLITEQDQSAAPRAPGMKYKHYAPAGRMILFERRDHSSSGSTKKHMITVMTELTHGKFKTETPGQNGEVIAKSAQMLSANHDEENTPILRLAILASSSWAKDDSTQAYRSDRYDLRHSIVNIGEAGSILSAPQDSITPTTDSKPLLHVNEFRLGEDPEVVARNLFASLRACDHLKCDYILAEAPFSKDHSPDVRSTDQETDNDEYETVLERMRKAASEVLLV